MFKSTRQTRQYRCYKKTRCGRFKEGWTILYSVGNNEYFALGQSAWAGASYEPSDIIKKKVDTSMKFVSNIGSVIKKVDDTSSLQQEKMVNS